MTMTDNIPNVRVNGVSVDAFFNAVHVMSNVASLGHYQFRAHNQWLDGGHTRTKVKDFFGAGTEQTSRATPFVMESDFPAVFKGTDRAMDPLEHLLAAIGACITTTIVWHAAARGIHVEAIDTWVEGDIDLQGWFGIARDLRPGYSEIRVSIDLEAEVPDETLDQLVGLGTEYSPLFDTISRGTRVAVTRVTR